MLVEGSQTEGDEVLLCPRACTGPQGPVVITAGCGCSDDLFLHSVYLICKVGWWQLLFEQLKGLGQRTACAKLGTDYTLAIVSDPLVR